MNKKQKYPFTAIVGQEKMKLGLILNAINPSIGGLLIRGEKGSGKATAVKSFTDLLPTRKEVVNCKFDCDPYDLNNMCKDCMTIFENDHLDYRTRKMKVIEIPSNISKEALVGSLEIEYINKEKKEIFKPGLLAYANRNIIYIDGVNLLEDHIVNLILESLTSGYNTIENGEASFTHPSKFILIATMNPEEGSLRPQLLDRFGIVVDVKGDSNVENRIEIIKRYDSYEKEGQRFVKKWEESEVELKNKIVESKKRLKKIIIEEDIYEKAVKLSMEMGLDGHRADINLIKVAKSITAFDGRVKIRDRDLLEASKFVFPHRIKGKREKLESLTSEYIENLV